MKTNQVMRRESGFMQRTKDGYFNATLLIEYWNDENPKSEKQLARYLVNKTTRTTS